MRKTNNTNDYDVLDAQIGNIGDSEKEVVKKENTPHLGKLQNYEKITGRKAELTPDELAELEKFRNRSKKSELVNESEQFTDDVKIADGWVLVDKNEMGLRAQFYPSSWEFYIKPASVGAIKNWTSVDESNPSAVSKVLNEIIKTSVKIDTNGDGVANWGAINSWDRFWFILKVRELTFVKGDTKIEFEDICSECGADLLYNLTSQSLFFDLPDSDLIEKYWDGRCWNIDPTEYNVESEPIVLYTPKLATDERIIEWATAQARNNKQIDENFVKFLMWLLKNPSRDLNILNRQIEKIYKEYKGWSLEMYEFMEDVIRNITVNPSENLKTKCPHCGGESVSTVRFPNGIKVLFRIETKAKKFGTK